VHLGVCGTNEYAVSTNVHLLFCVIATAGVPVALCSTSNEHAVSTMQDTDGQVLFCIRCSA
jgi:hypothetical protein